MTRRKTWREKLDDPKDLPKVQPITASAAAKWGPGTIVIPAPLEVEAIMKRVRRGKLITINQIREALAARHNATIACPIVTGIAARMAAGAAGDAEAAGAKRVTPYWRTLKSGGVLNEKYPGGVRLQRSRLEAEGHRVIAKGKKLVVDDFERALVKHVP